MPEGKDNVLHFSVATRRLRLTAKNGNKIHIFHINTDTYFISHMLDICLTMLSTKKTHKQVNVCKDS